MAECTCHPSDNPPKPCPRKYALGACFEAAYRTAEARVKELAEAGLQFANNLAAARVELECTEAALRLAREVVDAARQVDKTVGSPPTIVALRRKLDAYDALKGEDK